MRVWRRVLCLVVGVAVMGAVAQPAVAQPAVAIRPLATAAQGAVTVDRVWTGTADGKKDATSFQEGDGIRYLVIVDNTTGQTVPTTFAFESYGGGYYMYDYRQAGVAVPPGKS